jgi:predicted ATPase
LDALSERESSELVGHLLRVEDLPRALRARIVAHADGNPFYVEEILSSLIEGGVLVHDEAAGRWQATQDPDELPLPDTLRGVLIARIDRLPLAARRICQLASVVGRFFERRVLERLAQSQGDLEEGLSTLQQAQLIRGQSHGAAYVFKHQLTQEAAYESLLRRKRRELHRRVAQALEALYPDREEEQLGLLARHWERAGEVERAVAYLRRAGAQAAAQYANAEAIGYFSRGLDLLPEADREERYALLSARESALDLLGRRDAQQADLVALERLAKERADPGRQADVALRRAHYSIRVRAFEAAEEAARAALHWAESAQDQGRRAAAHGELGRALRYRSHADARLRKPARSELQRALELARSAGLARLEADALHELGAFAADLDQSQRYHQEQLRICRAAGYRQGEGRALRDVGLGWLHRYRIRKALDCFQQSLRVCREIGNRREEGWALQYLCLAHNTAGDNATALVYGRQALRVHLEIGDRTGEFEATYLLMQSAARMGDYAGAMEYGARFVGPQAPDRHWIVLMQDLPWRQGDAAVARAEYEKAIRRLDRGDYRRLVAQCGLAEMALAAGDGAEAARRVEQVLPGLGQRDWFSFRVGLYPFLACYRVLHAGHDPRAGEVLEQAYRLLQERASWIDDEGLRRSYLENVPANREIAALYERAR